MRLVNRINYFYTDLYINIETRELEGHQRSTLPSQRLHSGTSVGGIRRQRPLASPQMNLAVVILPSTGWESLSQRHCGDYKQSNGTETPLPSATLPCPPHAGAGSGRLLSQREREVGKAVPKLWVRALLAEALCGVTGAVFWFLVWGEGGVSFQL